jgi:hypothetical protein
MPTWHLLGTRAELEGRVPTRRTSSARPTLVERALDLWAVLDRHRDELARPMERAGRKANSLTLLEEAAV